MKKKLMGTVAWLLMAAMIASPVMAAEYTVDISDAELEETAVFTAEIPDGNTGEDAELIEDIPGEDVTGTSPDENIGEADPDMVNLGDADLDNTIPEGTDDPESSEEAEEAGWDDDEYGIEELSDNETEDDEDDAVIAVTGVSLDNKKLTINSKDQTPQLTATVSPSDATDPSVTWKSSDTKVVTVDKDGKLTAVKDGTATITVTTTDGGFTAECSVTVSLYSDGFHQDPDGTDWCWYKDGKIATGTTDIIQGKVNGTSGYWNVVKGRVEASATVAQGTVDGTNAWWYVNKKGMVDTSYTGFATNSSGSWYAENGKVTKKTNGVYKDTTGALGSSSDWYYILNSKVQTGFTGLADYSNASGWWYVTNGRVDRSVTTIAKNKNGWWYVENGKVNKSYTGFGTNSNGSWYVENGKVTKTVNGVFKDTTGALGSSSDWYYVLNSKVQTGFTGLADYSNASGWWYVTNGRVDRSVTTIAKNKNGWWYVENGKVNKSYTGFGTNSNGSWYAENGKVTKKTNGVYKDTTGALGSSSAWYYVLNSKVQYSFTGLADYSNASGWWYITKGKVDRSFTGLAKNKNGWYYLTNGKVDRSYTGTAQNSNGWWYVEKGKVDKSAVVLVKTDGVWQAYKNGKLASAYTGMAVNDNGWYYVDNGTYVAEEALTLAARFAAENSSSSQSSSSRLKACYDVLWSRYPYFRTYGDSHEASAMSGYAVDMFKNKGGNCLRYACSFACVAKVLGYDVRVAIGQISSINGGMTNHSWTEIYIDGEWLICDPDMQMNYPNVNVYMVKESDFPYRHTCSARYRLTISDGEVIWQ